MTFEIGYVPEGWERGDRLRLVNADFSAGPVAAVSREALMVCDFDADAQCLEFLIKFNYEERNRVSTWIKWWNDD
jgi:hypothetical protein